MKFNASCNSILLNFYGTCKIILRYHKDNEITLARTNNQVNSIYTISVRTPRRILFSLKRDGAHISFPLLHNSCFNMLRGCQEALFNSIAPGDLPNEQGQRYINEFGNFNSIKHDIYHYIYQVIKGTRFLQRLLVRIVITRIVLHMIISQVITMAGHPSI